MPVFVHGNPATAAVWEPLLAALGRDDVTRLSPPGFGSPLPPGFGATADEYHDWLVAELEAFGEPVDLVGHDLGGSHVVRVAMTRPDLLRSWVSDAVGVFHPDYRWHYLARLWRTPGVGEVDVARRFGGTVADRTAFLVTRGVPADVAARIAPHQNPAMGRAVLAHHRSTTRPTRSPRLAAHRPGLAVVATADNTAGTDVQRWEAAAAAGASVEVLEGLGHWWMVQDPDLAAKALTRFWESVPGSAA
ncbi:alpha/beta fold hydrolase [Umezawaea tangerina]|uniref:Pimeloyl-ACP methyl ester carboxylesterase n=1 Tax=Umezawaea tangerina TaxID=84725 RepID=A0A2T0SXR2_9PSEU|nr:alpha/beta hydrolase [Umezawaea tangerina]PRY38207.1 pimeloyl-ACP methyl ester carboxylesterase [Umezawaea tangerina]